MRFSDLRVPILVALCCLCVPSAGATTWTVEKDGSGDFMVIQDAINAAAPGDSIMIGPGRYDTFRPHNSTVTGSGFSGIMWVKTADLTIIGAGRDVTTVGPPVPTEDGDGGKTLSLHMDGGSAGSTVEGLHFENTATIVIIRDQITIEDSRVTRVPIISAAAVTVIGAADVVIRASEIIGPDGIITASGTTRLVIEDCTFDDPSLTGTHVCFCNGATDNVVRGSTFTGGATGVAFGFGGTGTVEDCVFTGMEFAGINMDQGSAIVRRCEFGETRQTLASNIGRLEVYDSLIGGGSQATLVAWSDVLIRGSHLLNSGEAPTVLGYGAAGRVVDIRYNWWGTTVTAQVQDWIVDEQGTILWDPIADAPIPTEGSSWGVLKGRFRRTGGSP